MAKVGRKPRVDWQAVELLYLTSPEEISLRELAARLALSENTVMTRAHRGQWAAKRAAAKARANQRLTEGETSAGELANTGIHETPEPVETADSEGQGESGGGKKALSKTDVAGALATKPKAGVLTAEELAERAATVKARRAEDYEKRMAAQASRLPEIMAEMSDLELLARAGEIEKLDKIARRNLGLEGSEGSQRAPLVQIAFLSNATRGAIPKAVSPSD